MKLDCGHLTMPVPWPIQSRPISERENAENQKQFAHGTFLAGGAAPMDRTRL